jgi:hypothetical protein
LYRKKTVFIILLCILFCMSALTCFGQDGEGESEKEKNTPPPVPSTYILGSQNIIVRLGPFIPLFFNNLSTGEIVPANLWTGVKFGFQWQGYLSNEWSVGAEINGSLAFSPNFNILWLLPIGVKGTYTIHMHPFEFPLSLTIGACMESFIDSSRIDFFVKPEIAGYWKIDATWGVGLNIAYLWIPQQSSEDQESVQSGQSFLGNFLEISVGLSFYF